MPARSGNDADPFLLSGPVSSAYPHDNEPEHQQCQHPRGSGTPVLCVTWKSLVHRFGRGFRGSPGALRLLDAYTLREGKTPLGT